ncbi:MAG: hypothetical protein PVG32_16575 [Anaerolineales bacterium]
MIETPQFSVEAPPWLVTTAYRQPDQNRIVLHFVNCQVEKPILEIENVQPNLKLAVDESALSIISIPEEKSIGFEQNEDTIRFNLPIVRLYQLAVITFA